MFADWKLETGRLVRYKTYISILEMRNRVRTDVSSCTVVVTEEVTKNVHIEKMTTGCSADLFLKLSEWKYR